MVLGLLQNIQNHAITVRKCCPISFEKQVCEPILPHAGQPGTWKCSKKLFQGILWLLLCAKAMGEGGGGGV